MNTADAKRVKELQKENARLKKLVAKLSLDNAILREFVAKRMRKWLSNLGVITTYIEPNSPRENGYVESFNSRMRDKFLNVELLERERRSI